MAYRGPAYGLSRELQLKTIAKFDADRAREALRWVEAVTGTPLEPSSADVVDHLGVKRALKSGVHLCQLINTLHPGSVKKINHSSLAFKEMENIEMFLRACRSYGMKEVDTFQTQDLFEAKAIYSVINTLYTLGSLAQKNGFDGPVIGVKLAEENRREFTEEQLAAGKKVIGLQYGTNRGSSQKGMTPYGMTRKM